MKKITLLLAAICITLSGFTQEIQWGELEKGMGRGSQVIPFNGPEFFTVSYTGRKTLLNYHNDLQIVHTEEISKRVPSGSGIIEDVDRLGEGIIVFLSDKKDGVNTLYYQLYSKDCIAVSDPVEALTFDIPKGWRSRGSYNVRSSSSGEFIALEYSIPGKKDETDRYGYKIMNKSLEVITSGEYESEYESREFNVSNRYMANSGDYFLLAKIYNTNEKGRVRDYTSLDKTLIVRAGNGDLETMEIKLEDDRSVTEMTFFEDGQGQLRVNGMYGKTGLYTAGIFYILVDFDRKEVLDYAYNEFDRDFITEGYTDRQKKKADKKEAKGKGAPQLYSFDFSESVINEDGSMIGVMEQYYITVVTTTDAKGNTTTTYYYHYNDIIVYKINANGEFEYAKKIQKRQVSANDGGYYSSYAMYLNGEELHLYFNDNVKNYDEEGNFIQPETNRELYTTSYRKKTNAVAEVVFNTSSGDLDRKVAFSRKETAAYAVPKKFATDYETRNMLLFLQMGKKEKYGLLKF